MTTAAPPASPQPAVATRARPVGPRWTRPSTAQLVPVLFTLANAVAFYLVRPDVNDLWAARARASAVSDGVGLTYWFGWFGGGSTPGTYSVLTPSLSALIGTELVCALAAVAVTVLGTLAVRGTRHPIAAAGVVAIGACVNLWSGRVPFLVGAAIAIGAVLALMRRRTGTTLALTLLSILASPVSGAFIAMGLSGTFLTTRTRDWRRIIGITVGGAGVVLLAVAVIFGSPGPEPFTVALLLGVLACLGLQWLARPADHVRTTIGASALVAIALFVVPNGMGSNFARFVWFCLPVVVVATSTRPRKLIALLVAPSLFAAAYGTAQDLHNAVQPISSVAFYQPLADRLDTVGRLRDYRVELVDHGAHAGYDALLGHALLARGWETQEDSTLNSSLKQDPLSDVTYKVWLDNNSVGYVALPTALVGEYPEYNLVRSRTPDYLRLVWASADWKLYEVSNPSPIVTLPGRVLGHTQSTLSVTIPCACTVGVRVRWSKFLDATLEPSAPARAAVADTPAVVGTVADDGAGWTTVTTTQPGTYVLSGSLRGLLR